jgi:RimJ/RimL family protein N-acetyltransferase
MYTHLPFGPFSSASEIDDYLTARIHHDPALVLFAVIDKTRSDDFHVDDNGAFAGVIAYLNTSAVNLLTEIGFVIILPAFQRTHVTSNAVGLLLQYALNLPSEGGLGLRRVQWQTNSPNAASIAVAERMGFRKEALLKWDRVFHGGWETDKTGNNRTMPRRGAAVESGESNKEPMGRDTVMLSLCFDDWEEGGKEKVEAAMNRR